MKHDPRFEENDITDYKIKKELSKLSIEELDRPYEKEDKRIRKIPKLSEM